MDKSDRVTDEDIIEAINEWPVTDNYEDLYTSPTSRVHNPASVSSFFLRNVGKVKKVLNKMIYINIKIIFKIKHFVLSIF